MVHCQLLTFYFYTRNYYGIIFQDAFPRNMLRFLFIASGVISIGNKVRTRRYVPLSENILLEKKKSRTPIYRSLINLQITGLHGHELSNQIVRSITSRDGLI